MTGIPLSSRKYPGLVAWIDAEDASKVAGYSWFVAPTATTFYAYAWHIKDYQRRRIWMHRLIAGVDRPDHKDGDGLNNRKANLRPATRQQQARNAGLQQKKPVGSKGVSWSNQYNRWRVRIGVRRRNYDLGTFRSMEEAGRMYDAAAVLLFGEFARTNYPIVDEDMLRRAEAILRRKSALS